MQLFGVHFLFVKSANFVNFAKNIILMRLLLLFLFLTFGLNSFSQEDEKIVIVIIDGARYTETLGDNTRTYTPKMWELAEEGTMIDKFYNDNYTYTSRAIPALWCGAWTDVRDTVYEGHETNYAVLPTIFEYYRKQKSVPAEECYYVLKELESLWLPSFDNDYGPDYWPAFHSVGETDTEVAEQALQVMEDHHPHFLWVYFADVDHAGHSGIWSNYTGAIHTADSLVDVLWNAIQSDPFYADATTMIVTNDHGRHDDQHGGFQGHGCGCEGCRHIELLAIGPHIKENYVSQQYRYTPDMAVTASYIAGLDPEKATGHVMQEIFEPNGIANNLLTNSGVFPNPFSIITEIDYTLTSNSTVTIDIRDFSGKIIRNLISEKQPAGEKSVKWDGTDNFGHKVPAGIYFYTINSGTVINSGKVIYLP
jgi:hypothetical protein